MSSNCKYNTSKLKERDERESNRVIPSINNKNNKNNKIKWHCKVKIKGNLE